VKGFLVFGGVVTTVVLLGFALPYLDNRERDYEQRFVGALNFTEETIEGAFDLPAGIYKPKIAPGPKPGHWKLSGTLVSKDSLGGMARVPFLAVLQSLCVEPGNPECWQMVRLEVDGRTVRTLPSAELAPNTAAEDVAGQTVDPGGASATLSVDQAAVASSQPDQVMPVPAAGTLDAAAVLATDAPATSSTTAAAVVGTEDSPAAAAETAVSNQELILFIQDALKRLDYEPGPIDGKFGGQTASAIKAYQRDFNLSPDGRPTPALLRHLRGQLGNLGQQSRDPSSSEAQPSG